jgi:hypothetical protein
MSFPMRTSNTLRAWRLWSGWDRRHDLGRTSRLQIPMKLLIPIAGNLFEVMETSVQRSFRFLPMILAFRLRYGHEFTERLCHLWGMQRGTPVGRGEWRWWSGLAAIAGLGLEVCLEIGFAIGGRGEFIYLILARPVACEGECTPQPMNLTTFKLWTCEHILYEPWK